MCQCRQWIPPRLQHSHPLRRWKWRYHATSGQKIAQLGRRPSAFKKLAATAVIRVRFSDETSVAIAAARGPGLRLFYISAPLDARDIYRPHGGGLLYRRLSQRKWRD